MRSITHTLCLYLHDTPWRRPMCWIIPCSEDCGSESIEERTFRRCCKIWPDVAGHPGTFSILRFMYKVFGHTKYVCGILNFWVVWVLEHRVLRHWRHQRELKNGNVMLENKQALKFRACLLFRIESILNKQPNTVSPGSHHQGVIECHSRGSILFICFQHSLNHIYCREEHRHHEWGGTLQDQKREIIISYNNAL